MKTTTPPPINLLRGWPAPSLLPTTDVQAAAQEAWADPAVSTPALLYGPDEGYAPLRREVARWLGDFYGAPAAAVAADPARICITGGASQSLACILQVFTDPLYTRRVWMAAPCYFLACRIFEDAGFAGRLRAVPEDDEGVDVQFLESAIRKVNEESGPAKPTLKPVRPWSKIYKHVIYLVPTFSNPSGKTMSLQRRHQLVRLARRHDALIITDDVYDSLQWSTDPALEENPNDLSTAILPRLSDIDRELGSSSSSSAESDGDFGHAVSNGSFSKIAGPGFRTGWVDAAPRFSTGLSQAGSSRSGGCPSQLTATLVWRLLRDGRLERHIRDVLRPAYARRHARLMAAVDRCLLPLGVECCSSAATNPGGGGSVFGGYFVWLALPRPLDAESVAERAREVENLIVAPGNLFEVYGDEESVRLGGFVRVCFSWEAEDLLAEGIERLGRVIADLLRSPPERVEKAKVASTGLADVYR